jgi:hypothetical protein
VPRCTAYVPQGPFECRRTARMHQGPRWCAGALRTCTKVHGGAPHSSRANGVRRRIPAHRTSEMCALACMIECSAPVHRVHQGLRWCAGAPHMHTTFHLGPITNLLLDAHSSHVGPDALVQQWPKWSPLSCSGCAFFEKIFVFCKKFWSHFSIFVLGGEG